MPASGVSYHHRVEAVRIMRPEPVGVVHREHRPGNASRLGSGPTHRRSMRACDRGRPMSRSPGTESAIMPYVHSDPYPWPYNGELTPGNTALIVIDMQADFCGRG